MTWKERGGTVGQCEGTVMATSSGAEDRRGEHPDRTLSVLLVAPLFAPSSLVGALRWSSLVRLLVERGVSFDLVVPHRADGEPDAGVARAAHGIRRTVELPPLELSVAQRARRWIAARTPWVDPPEPDVAYWRGHALRLPSIVSLERYDAIVTTGPPHSIHQVGLAANRNTGIPWIADFRDPLIGDSRFDKLAPGAKRTRLHEFHTAIVANASAIVHASELSARLMGESAALDHVHVVRNGADLERLRPSSIAFEPAAVLFEGQEMQIASFGRWARDDVSVLVSALRAMDLRTRVHLYGRITPGDDDPHVTGSPVTEVVWHGQVSHDEALGRMSHPQLLVVLLGEERSNVSGTSTKLYEYIATGNPILAVNPTPGDRELLEEVDRCVIIERPSEDSVRAGLEQVRTLPALTADALQRRRDGVSSATAADQMLRILRTAIGQ